MWSCVICGLCSVNCRWRGSGCTCSVVFGVLGSLRLSFVRLFHLPPLLMPAAAWLWGAVDGVPCCTESGKDNCNSWCREGRACCRCCQRRVVPLPLTVHSPKVGGDTQQDTAATLLVGVPSCVRFLACVLVFAIQSEQPAVHVLLLEVHNWGCCRGTWGPAFHCSARAPAY
jgi:hypothetical protein